jgi:hypothetical protein
VCGEYMTDKEVTKIAEIVSRTFQNWKKRRVQLYKVVRLGAIAMDLGYTENELKFLREKRERELKELYQKRT